MLYEVITPKLPGKPEGTHPVKDSEVDHLGPATELGRNLVGRHTEDAARGGDVDILPVPEPSREFGVPRKMRKKPQLHLGVVGADEETPRFCHEPRPDPPSQVGAHRNVLQVGIA